MFADEGCGLDGDTALNATGAFDVTGTDGAGAGDDTGGAGATGAAEEVVFGGDDAAFGEAAATIIGDGVDTFVPDRDPAATAGEAWTGSLVITDAAEGGGVVAAGAFAVMTDGAATTGDGSDGGVAATTVAGDGALASNRSSRH